MEIYIPKCADVKSVPLLSLPSSVVSRMGLPACDSTGTKALQDSPEGIWICPVVIRKKGQTLVSHAGSGVKEKVLSLLDRQSRSESGSCRMSFVSSNRVAYKLLKDTMPGNTVASSSPSLPQSSSPQTCQDAVVIYRGQIYLSVRKPGRRQSSQSTSASASKLPPKRQKERPNDDGPRKKLARCEVTLADNTKGVEQTVGDVSSSTPARPVPPSADGVHVADPPHQDAREDKSTEGAAAQEHGGLQHQEEAAGGDESGGREGPGGEAAEGADAQVDSGDVARGWIPGEPLGAATSAQSDFDFNELAQEEKIARMKARLRQREAALENMKIS